MTGWGGFGTRPFDSLVTVRLGTHITFDIGRRLFSSPLQQLLLTGDRRLPPQAAVAASEFAQRLGSLARAAHPPQQRRQQQLGLTVNGPQGQQGQQLCLCGQPVAGEIGIPGLNKHLFAGGILAEHQRRRKRGDC